MQIKLIKPNLQGFPKRSKSAAMNKSHLSSQKGLQASTLKTLVHLKKASSAYRHLVAKLEEIKLTKSAFKIENRILPITYQYFDKS